MAKTNKARPVKPNETKKTLYPRESIDIGIEEDSIRWHINSIVWYKRLIDSIMGLLIVSIICFFISLIFVLKQPLPLLYATSMDGTLYELPYTRTLKDENFNSIRESLVLEKKDIESMGGQKVLPQIRQQPLQRN